MKVIAILCMVLGTGCMAIATAAFAEPWNPNNSIGENLRGCTSDGCPDRDTLDDYTAQQFAGFALAAARGGDCVCALSLVTASGVTMPAVRLATLHEPTMQSCLDPRMRAARWAEASRARTLTRCAKS